MVSSASIRQAREAAALGLTIVRPRRTLFVFSHMRSYSSLLCHILGSNQAVTGYVELHNRYSDFTDLYRLRGKVALMNGGQLKGPFVLDKVLFNQWEISTDILTRSEVYSIFSIREPEATIKSTIAMAGGPSKASTNWKADAHKVGQYYRKRAHGLIELAERRPANSAFFVSERLIDRTDDTLAMLTSFLKLRKPLVPSYQRFEHTQKPRFGDPGKYISTGEIVAKRREYDFEVPADVIESSREVYEKTVLRLGELCGSTLRGDHA